MDLRRHLKERGRLAILARATGLDYHYLWQVMNGDKEPRFDTALTIGDGLGLTLDQAVDGRRNNRPLPSGDGADHPLRALARAHGWSDAGLADRAGVSRQHLSHIITGRRRPSIGVLARLARTGGVSLDALARRLSAAPDA